MDKAQQLGLNTTSRQSKPMRVLPRSAWSSEVTKLRLLLKTKQLMTHKQESLYRADRRS